MVPNETADEPPYLGNVLFLVGAFFIAGIATLTVVSIVGVEGIVAYAIATVAFVAAFIGLLLFYNSYYLAD
ncbi:hypothetical protein [Natrialba aegyptia]|uniref:Uncharacterized protein n=1 Tax=Natrialba aegyptia DSM 13077 TaxID=1227491 RepID=M0B7W1_9EURY|nr:hypothetical protein [Natrialba aegyptia]ELZ06582.1 hypothetical protein C480_09110 [Natrialba aegyptia DSM 13077]